ncbi:MAG: hypothetical protein KGI00_01050 [Candidatus Micrarchaeota archaeon]|nr:hypothetical protein [Candidatus Micrarchaeota archaeon]MDE1849295.1 hypothetical protein [Candidatus Micrarchaeota archaeon]
MDSSDLLIFKLRKEGGETGKAKEKEKPAQAPKTVPKPEPKIEPRAVPRAEEKVIRMAPKQNDVKNLNCISHPWRPAYAICSVCNLPFCYADIMTHNGKYYCLADIDKASMEKEVQVQRNTFNYVTAFIFAANTVVLFLFFNQQAYYIIGYIMQSGISSLIHTYNYSYMIALADTVMLLCNAIAALVSLSRSNRAFLFSSVVVGFSMMLLVYEYLTSGTQNLLLSAVILLFALMMLTFSRMSSIGSVADRMSVANVEWPHPGAYQ